MLSSAELPGGVGLDTLITNNLWVTDDPAVPLLCDRTVTLDLVYTLPSVDNCSVRFHVEDLHPVFPDQECVRAHYYVRAPPPPEEPPPEETDQPVF